MNRYLPAILTRLFAGSVARGTLAATAWQGVRVASQALWMIVVARALGAAGYGSFAGAAGLATAVGSLTGLGFGLLMLQDASRDASSFASGWKRSTVVCLVSGFALWMAYAIAAPRIIPLPGSAWQFAAIGIPELVCFPLTIVASYAFQTRERMGWAGAMYALVPASNLIAVALFLLFARDRSLAGYLPWHAGCSMLAAIAALTTVSHILTPGHVNFTVNRRDTSEAMGFSLMRIVDNGLGSLDKTLVLRLAGAEAAGIYTAAFRLVVVLALPVTSLAMAALPKLFRIDSARSGEGRGFVRRLALLAGLGGGAAMLGVFALSLAIPWLLGPSFQAAAGFARWLCLFPLLYGLSSLGCNILIASRLRRYRITAQIGGLAVLIGAMYLAIPPLGLVGAALALLAAHAVIVLTVWWVVRRTARHSAG